MVVQIEVQHTTRKGDDGQSAFEIGVVKCSNERQDVQLVKERHVVVEDDDCNDTLATADTTRNSLSTSSVVNTHQSLLNITSDVEEEEEEEEEEESEEEARKRRQSCLFDDLNLEQTEMPPPRDRSLVASTHYDWETESYLAPTFAEHYDDATTVAEHHQRCCVIVPAGSSSVVTERPNGRLASWFDRSKASLSTVTETFVDNVMCTDASSNANCAVGSYLKTHYAMASTMEVQLEWDILHLLSCMDRPTSDEQEQVWSDPLMHLFATTDAERRSMDMENLAAAAANNFTGHKKDESSTTGEPQEDSHLRALRIHRLSKRKKMLQQQRRAAAWQVPRSASMDDSILFHKKVPSSSNVPSLLDSLFGSAQQATEVDERTTRLRKQQRRDFEDAIGKGLEPISSQSEDDSEEDGYDSDSDLFLLKHYSHRQHLLHTQRSNGSSDNSTTTKAPSLLPPPPSSPDALHSSLTNLVQDSLNYSWKLVWHREGSRPQKVEAWLERGTLLNDGATVVEPKIMWRSLDKNRFETPHSLRMLNACRILAVRDDDETTIDTSATATATATPATAPPSPPRPWMARSSHCFILRTVDHESYLMEAESEQQRNEICLRWKAVVARLATLAVLEDMVTLADEFFA
eukprot:CAMPEP_0194065812 /NCGR_PEP_ID=MMETSP0009_2-20130614/85678_1 /TAXON_ID=210454 /ORGANISM="Grammatophora oceanica, Strain CCMP 410" /LENGTH=631 /DNA_ID=CAMNT_0038718703 /DNA_START=1595 /DNA_END=3486 /DNA_ORIENTATION=-